MNKEPERHVYVVNHMDEYLFEWSLCEYLQIDRYLAPLANSSFLLSNFDSISNFASDSAKNMLENKTNIGILLSQSQKVSTAPLDIGQYICESSRTIQINDKPVDFSRVCLLDLRADQPLTPADASQFEVFLFGGILGDHPPRDRTSALRKLGFAIRSLGRLQMSTDTAVLTTSLIVDRGRKIEEIAFIEEPEIEGKRKGESVQIEGFRYVDGAYSLEDGTVDLNNRGRVARMHEKIREELLFKELDPSDFF